MLLYQNKFGYGHFESRHQYDISQAYNKNSDNQRNNLEDEYQVVIQVFSQAKSKLPVTVLFYLPLLPTFLMGFCYLQNLLNIYKTFVLAFIITTSFGITF